MTDPYAETSFEAFWPHYVRMHSRPETQRMHLVATMSFGALVVAAVAKRSPALLLLAPIADYAIAQTSHRVFEKNRTLPWKNHLWHARAELRMAMHVLRGTMQDEVDRSLAGQ